MYWYVNWHTLVFQLKDTVCLFGTLLVFDPIHLPKGETWCLIGSEQKEKELFLLIGSRCYEVYQFWGGLSLWATTCIWIMSFKMTAVTYIPPDTFSILWATTFIQHMTQTKWWATTFIQHTSSNWNTRVSLLVFHLVWGHFDKGQLPSFGKLRPNFWLNPT